MDKNDLNAPRGRPPPDPIGPPRLMNQQRQAPPLWQHAPVGWGHPLQPLPADFCAFPSPWPVDHPAWRDPPRASLQQQRFVHHYTQMMHSHGPPQQPYYPSHPFGAPYGAPMMPVPPGMPVAPSKLHAGPPVVMNENARNLRNLPAEVRAVETATPKATYAPPAVACEIARTASRASVSGLKLKPSPTHCVQSASTRDSMNEQLRQMQFPQANVEIPGGLIEFLNRRWSVLHREGAMSLRCEAKLQKYGSAVSGLAVPPVSDLDLSLSMLYFEPVSLPKKKRRKRRKKSDPVAFEDKSVYAYKPADIIRFAGEALKSIAETVVSAKTGEVSSNTERSESHESLRVTKLLVLPAITVPVLKCSINGLKVDITAENNVALHNTELLRHYSQCHPVVRLLCLLVKKWARARRINDAFSHTLSSYALICMVLFFLQHEGVLPVLQLPHWASNRRDELAANVIGTLRSRWTKEVQRLHLKPNLEHSEPTTCAEFDVTFDRDMSTKWFEIKSETPSLASLLTRFFAFYGFRIDWSEHVPSIRLGVLLSRRCKKTLCTKKTMCIEDPFELDHNLSKSVTRKTFRYVCDEFRDAYDICAQTGDLEELFKPFDPEEENAGNPDDELAAFIR
ncbi:MAG: hypothetical protein MHM6MM_002740 [Cercozoa sp. M6MM]